MKIDQLQEKVWGYNSELETHTVETHVYRLRKKINDKFYDNEFIISDKKGYFLNEKKKIVWLKNFFLKSTSQGLLNQKKVKAVLKEKNNI